MYVTTALARDKDARPGSFPGQEVSKNGVKTAPLAPRRPRDREPLFLPSLSPLLQAQNGFPTTYAPGLSKTATYTAYYIDRFNYKIRTAFLLPARLIPTTARQSATQLSRITFSQLSEPT